MIAHTFQNWWLYDCQELFRVFLSWRDPHGDQKWWHSVLGAVGPRSQPMTIGETQKKNLVCSVFVATLASWLKNRLLDSFELLKSGKNWQICSSLKLAHYKHVPYKSIFDFTFSPNKNYQIVVIVQRHCNFFKFRCKTLSLLVFVTIDRFRCARVGQHCRFGMINLPQHDI